MRYLIAVAVLTPAAFVLASTPTSTETFRQPQTYEQPQTAVLTVTDPFLQPTEDAEREDWTTEQIKALIRATFPEESERALRVAWCESEYDPGAYNPTNGSHDGGVFQVSKKYHGAELKARGLDRFDVADNVAFARILYDRRGWQDWSASERCWRI